MEDKETIKTLSPKYDWKDYLLNNITNVQNLKKYNNTYLYKNKIQEENLEKWCFQAVWVGRSQGNYKCHPEFLLEGDNKLLSSPQSEINSTLEKLKDELIHSGI